MISVTNNFRDKYRVRFTTSHEWILQRVTSDFTKNKEQRVT